MLAGVVLTVFAPFIPTLEQDFQGRPEVPAHRNARPVRAVSKRPARAPRPVADDARDAGAVAAVAEQDSRTRLRTLRRPGVRRSTRTRRRRSPPHGRRRRRATRSSPSSREPQARQQAFWALAPEERDVVDESGIPIFRVGPTAWALVIEDRGEAFVVRHEDGRIGYLHDVEGVTRG